MENTNDGSLEQATDKIVGLLNQSGSTNAELGNLNNNLNSAKEEPAEQVTEELLEQSNTEQPTDSDSAVIDESKAESEQLSDAEQEEEPKQETEIVQEPTEETYTVKVQGQDYNVNLEELKAGYSRDNDYRIKTETLAIEKNQFKEEQAKQQSILSEKIAQLDQMQEYAKQQLQLDAKGLDELMQSDPVSAIKKKHELEQRARQIHQQNAYIENQKSEANSKRLKDEQKKMYLSIPELKNPETRDKFNSDLVHYLTDLNFSSDEIGGVNDHRYVQLIADGMRWKTLQKNKPQLKKKVEGATPVLKGGVVASKETKNARARQDKMARFKKSGDVKDATDILADLFKT